MKPEGFGPMVPGWWGWAQVTKLALFPWGSERSSTVGAFPLGSGHFTLVADDIGEGATRRGGRAGPREPTK
jgi:hypothetical protein